MRWFILQVANLLDRMESLRKIPLPVGIHTALNRQQTAISIIQAIRKEEISNISKYQQQQRTLFTENRRKLILHHYTYYNPPSDKHPILC